MSGYTRWSDLRGEHVDRGGGEEAVAAERQELMAQVIGRRLAELRRSRGLTQAMVAERMGVTKGRVSQIERGQVSGQDVPVGYAAALGDDCTRRSTSRTATSPPSPDPSPPPT